MASDPSSEQVQNFKEFTGATTDEAVKYLKVGRSNRGRVAGSVVILLGH